ncbi:hypothetical protein Thein_1260 [Thermodesulfatator indicus DSM 15286]|uniref:TraB determinant protein n=1 Tax=Thermodesulfatator indicus (strain DSM 15286 / JCM 11887 / CIR29812) TaxID=667014 RepID=F8A8N8_THEID|nr:hypothetical protein [Thermodesulfatator indicus]AEH45128.1 hypothetical protein Thein_1260 [Thermodesulfatator indicus DSM 15286]
MKKHELPRAQIGSSEIIFLPVLHGKLEFAQVVRNYLLDIKPEAVAVEYPETLAEKILRGVKRLPLLSVVSYQEKDGTTVYLLVEPVEPLIEAVRTGLEIGSKVHFVDLDLDGYQGHKEVFPDSYAVSRLGYEKFLEEALKVDYPKDPLDIHREKTIAYRLKQLAKRFRSIVFVGGLAHVNAIKEFLKEELAQPLARRKREGVSLFHLDQASSREVLSEIGYFQGIYEKERTKQLTLDRLELQQRLLEEALSQHEEKNKEVVPPRHLKILNQFARNYALTEGRLTPDFYQLLVAARGSVNDDFAWELWEIGTRYPFQTENPEICPIRINLDDLFKPHKKLKFFRKLKPLRRKRLVPVKKRPLEKRPGQWKESWKGINICSFPPEDIVVEGFGRYVMKKALRVLAEDLRRVEPFTSSLKDGIDLRETIRNWYEGRLYVREERPITGKVGSVVVIFDEDEAPDGKERYPWKITWHGEHDQESDMAFYATRAGEVVVGPGISRCHYGGFMLTYPPMRVYDIWSDPIFDFARGKAERLLIAAIDYSLEKYVVYIAKKPPSSLAKRFATHQGKKVIYLPIGQFSPALIKKIQTFHVLEGHKVRLYAHKYIEGE